MLEEAKADLDYVEIEYDVACKQRKRAQKVKNKAAYHRWDRYAFKLLVEIEELEALIASFDAPEYAYPTWPHQLHS